MSLYNGFPTHQQEQKYYNLIRYLVLVMEKRLLRFYQDQPCNEKKFINILYKLKNRITKIQNNKYSQPKFADSLNSLLLEIRTQQQKKLSRFDSFQTKSYLSNNGKSQLSFDLSFDRLPNVSKVNSRLKQNQQALRAQRKKYRSFQSIKTTPIIPQIEQWSNKINNRSSRLRTNQLSSIKLRLNPPKVQSYIDKIKRQTKILQMMTKKNRKETEQVRQTYLGQRRKKNKKAAKAYEV